MYAPKPPSEKKINPYADQISLSKKLIMKTTSPLVQLQKLIGSSSTTNKKKDLISFNTQSDEYNCAFSNQPEKRQTRKSADTLPKSSATQSILNALNGSRDKQRLRPSAFTHTERETQGMSKHFTFEKEEESLVLSAADILSESDRPVQSTMRPTVSKNSRLKKSTPSFNKTPIKRLQAAPISRFNLENSSIDKKIVPTVKLQLEHSQDGRFVVRSAKSASSHSQMRSAIPKAQISIAKDPMKFTDHGRSQSDIDQIKRTTQNKRAAVMARTAKPQQKKSLFGSVTSHYKSDVKTQTLVEMMKSLTTKRIFDDQPHKLTSSNSQPLLGNNFSAAKKSHISQSYCDNRIANQSPNIAISDRSHSLLREQSNAVRQTQSKLLIAQGDNPLRRQSSDSEGGLLNPEHAVRNSFSTVQKTFTSSGIGVGLQRVNSGRSANRMMPFQQIKSPSPRLRQAQSPKISKSNYDEMAQRLHVATQMIRDFKERIASNEQDKSEIRSQVNSFRDLLEAKAHECDVLQANVDQKAQSVGRKKDYELLCMQNRLDQAVAMNDQFEDQTLKQNQQIKEMKQQILELSQENAELHEAKESLQSRLNSIAETRDQYARMVENYRNGKVRKSTLKQRSISPIDSAAQNRNLNPFTRANELSLPIQEDQSVPDGVMFKSPIVTSFQHQSPRKTDKPEADQSKASPLRFSLLKYGSSKPDESMSAFLQDLEKSQEDEVMTEQQVVRQSRINPDMQKQLGRVSTIDSGDFSSITKTPAQKNKRIQELRKALRVATANSEVELNEKRQLKVEVDTCAKVCSDILEKLEHKEIPSAQDFEKEFFSTIEKQLDSDLLTLEDLQRMKDQINKIYIIISKQ